MKKIEDTNLPVVESDEAVGVVDPLLDEVNSRTSSSSGNLAILSSLPTRTSALKYIAAGGALCGVRMSLSLSSDESGPIQTKTGITFKMN